MMSSKNYKQEMINRAAEMLENEDYSGLEAMAEILLKSANMKQVPVQEAKDKLANYEDSFNIGELAAAVDALIDAAA